MIRYDNLKPAVIRIALGRERFEHPRFVAMRSHYGYDSFFCVPGIDGRAREGRRGGRDRPVPPPPPDPDPARGLAGGVERGAGRRGRPRRRPPHRRPHRDRRRGGGRESCRCCAPLPAEPFDVALRLSCRVDAKARICVRQSYYSVPARYAGRRLEVRLGATSITVYDGARIVAEHARSLHKGSEDLVLGPLPGSAVPQTRRAGRRRPR